MKPEPTTDELNGNIRRRMWTLAVVAALLALGIWNLAGRTSRIDVAGYYYHCDSAWDSLMISTNEPYPLGIQDSDVTSSALSEDQRDAQSFRTCHDNGVTSVRTNLLWMIPLLGLGVQRGVSLNKKVHERDSVRRQAWEERVKAAREIQG